MQIALGNVQNATDQLKLNFTYNTTTGGTPNADNNGNVLSQTITVPTVGSNQGFTAVQTYTYDALNRIKDAKELIGTTEQWKQTFHYDRYGNRTFDEGGTSGNYLTTNLTRNCQTSIANPNGICDKKKFNPAISPSNNRLVADQDADSQDDYSYDPAGNTTKDADNRRFTYDGENKQIKVETIDANGNPIATIGLYYYDGDGKRVKKIVPNRETTIFVYDASGKMVAEYSTIVAPQQDAKTSYLTNDHLGSPRITTDANGTVVSRRDFQPFGEEIARANYGSDSVRQKFTSYERDDETDLDFAQARYYSNQHGRFTSTDPLYIELRRLGDPQKINLYVYARNNPLLFTDPNGLEVTVNDKTIDGTGDDDYKKIVNGRKDGKFQIGINNNKVIIVDAKGNALSINDLDTLGKTLKGGEKELFNAITNTNKNATVNIVRDDPNIFFGAYEKKGENTIDVGDAAKLDNSKNTGGRTAFMSVAHETLEAFYTISKNLGEKSAHNLVDPMFPGLSFYKSASGRDEVRNAIGIKSTDGKFVTGYRGDFDVPSIPGVSERITFEYVTQIPVQSFKGISGQGVNIKSIESVKE